MPKKKYSKNKKVDKLTELLKHAREHLKKENYSKTVSYCQKAAGHFDNYTDKKIAAPLYFTWVYALLKLKDYQPIESIINQAEQSMGNYLDLVYLRILSASNMSRMDDVLKYVEDFEELFNQTNPKTDSYLKQSYNSIVEMLWIGGEAAYQKTDYSKAFDYMERSLESNPGHHPNRLKYAKYLADQHKDDKAIAVIEEGIEKYPDETGLKNAKGLILARLKQFDEAENYFKKLLEKYPTNSDTLNNLGVVFDKQGKYDLAKSYFEKALKIDPDNKQTKENIDYINNLMVDTPQTISACMIVKNEEKFLPGCLESIKDLVDEIIIVDTGSTDRTMEIAREYGAKIYEHPWQNDFSLHRNQSIDYASSNWILIIDADEEFDPEEHEKIRMLVKRKNVNGFSFVVYNKINYDRTGSLQSIRIFQSNKGYKYDGIVHNQLRITGKVIETDLKVIHYGYNLSEEDMHKKVRRSEALLLKQIEKDPDYLFAHFNLAQLYRGEADFKKCLEYSKTVVENSSFDTKGHRHLHLMALDQMGCSYFGIDETEKAIETFEHALELKSDFLDPLFNLGLSYFKLAKYDDAEKYFQQYLDVRTNYSPHDDDVKLMLNNLSSEHIAYYMLGFVYFIKEDYDAALEKLNRALDYVDDVKDVHSLLARCYRIKNDFTMVIKHCEKAVKYNHEDAEVRFLEGEAHLREGNSQKALECFNRALELNPDLQEAKIGIINIETLNKNPQEVLEIIDQYLEKSPLSPKVLASKGNLLFDLGQFSIARQSYIRSQEQDPDDYRVLNNLGNCFLKEKNYASAIDCYETAIQKNIEFHEAYRNIGVTLIRQNKVVDAIEYFEQYLTKRPDDVEVRATTGDLYYSNKKYNQAIPHYEKYMKRYPENIDAVIRLSDCYMNLGKLQAAALGYTSVLNKEPSNKVARQRLEDLNSFLQPVDTQ